MAKKKNQGGNTPMIDRLQRQGESKNQILDDINGGHNQHDVSRQQLQSIGFSQDRIQTILQRQRQGLPTAPHQQDGTPNMGGWNMPTWGWHPGGGNGGGSGPSGTKGGPSGTGGGTGQQAPSALDLWIQQQNQQQQQSAFSLMSDLLNQYGLGSLSGKLSQLVKSGITDQATLQLELENTPEWKQRFAGNEELRKKDLPVLSVADYLSTESSYAQIAKQYGLPDGFLGHDDFANFIGNAVSPSELRDRVQMYSDISKREDPAIKQQLASMGMSEGDLLAYTIDPKKAEPLIQQKYQTTLIGAAARRQGLTENNDYLSHLADLGVTEQQAMQGFGEVAQDAGTLEKLGAIYGTPYTQRDLENEVFLNDGQAANKRKRLASQERAAFSGQSGVRPGSLQQNTAGLF